MSTSRITQCLEKKSTQYALKMALIAELILVFCAALAAILDQDDKKINANLLGKILLYGFAETGLLSAFLGYQIGKKVERRHNPIFNLTDVFTINSPPDIYAIYSNYSKFKTPPPSPSSSSSALASLDPAPSEQPLLPSTQL